MAPSMALRRQAEGGKFGVGRLPEVKGCFFEVRHHELSQDDPAHAPGNDRYLRIVFSNTRTR
jgi:hypothetical protein